MRPEHFFSTRGMYTASLVMLLAVPASSWAQPTQSRSETSDDLTVRLVDAESNPIAGARIGFEASFGDNSFEAPSWVFVPDPASLERLPTEVISDEQGMATFKGGKTIASKYRVALVARQEELHLAGVTNLSREGNDDVKMVLYPECRITGNLQCGELESKGLELHRNWVGVNFNKQLCIEHYSNTSGFEMYLPPGEYSLFAVGGDGGTLKAERSLVVPVGVAEIELFPIELSLKPSRGLGGRPAPELTDVIAWKGDGPKSLKDLKGKVVLLDFWGYWCQACIAKMPRLIELDNLYRQHGLVILGLHIDTGEKITSLPEYDAFMERLKEKALGGKEVAYPVALIAEKETPFAGNSAKAAMCKIAAAYGVDRYPTMILIDRNGNIVGEFHDTPEDLATLKKLLGLPDGSDESKP
ncbi:MAG: redoxin domain-containing protein [Planctomycetaceae bacterium]|nr:redoxin domain-containing protein [Planctomycetaceae bacterium]MCB9953117.1 redoxin domain-containing protein [Planctomycetaceae bacterium]